VALPEGEKTKATFADGSEAPDISVRPVKEPTLAEAQFDPFTPYKTEPEKYSYRALNIRPQNMRTRQAEGWETIPGSEYGDLILGKLPLREMERRVKKEEKKIRDRTHAAADRFKQDAAEMGVKTFEEK
jgi:hypothetical protein